MKLIDEEVFGGRKINQIGQIGRRNCFINLID